MSDKDIQILIVDDDPQIIDLIKFHLRGSNYNLKSAQNGQMALSILKEESFDLILVDRLMPRMDGITFIKRINEQNLYDGQIIMISAYDNDDKLLNEVYDLIFDILPKPFTSFRLKLTIRNAIKLSILQNKYSSLINSVIKE